MEKTHRFNKLDLAIFVIFFSVITMNAQLERLDSVIMQRNFITKEKEKSFDELKRILNSSKSSLMRLEMADRLVEEYTAFSYDSALKYSDKELIMARELNNEEFIQRALLRKALLHARGGYYIEAEEILKTIDPDSLGEENKYHYYTTQYWLNMYLGNSSKDMTLKPIYRENMANSLKELLQHTDKNSAEYNYLLGEKLKLLENRPDLASNYYLKVVENVPENSKLYASSAYSIATYHNDIGDREGYKKWLAEAAISDLKTPLKENLAMQELAMLIYQDNPEDIERATRYLLIALDDAIFYDNRTRAIEIAEKMPNVLPLYLANIEDKERRTLVALIIVSVLVIILIAMLFYIKKQYKTLHSQKDNLHKQGENLKELNVRLNDLNFSLKDANNQLSESNQKLHDINIRRESLAKTWIDICAAHIYKLKSYKIMVRQKVKAKLTNDLLNADVFKPISEDDAHSFLMRFDKSFLDLYPDFIEEINKLLKEDCKVTLKMPNTLTTELRICALIRLGVKDSSEMGDLLFASTQTIYNNRTKMRNRAINKEEFEDSLKEICSGK